MSAWHRRRERGRKGGRERGRRTWGVEQQQQPREAREPVRAVHLGGDGGDEGEEAAAEEAVEDREDHLCVCARRSFTLASVTSVTVHEVVTQKEGEQERRKERKEQLTIPAYVVTNIHTTSCVRPEAAMATKSALTGPRRSAAKPTRMRPSAAETLSTVRGSADICRGGRQESIFNAWDPRTLGRSDAEREARWDTHELAQAGGLLDRERREEEDGAQVSAVKGRRRRQLGIHMNMHPCLCAGRCIDGRGGEFM